ncbi:hypothetical protein V8G54_000680 [Vigna mungo]|uniref:Transposase MuDR plant domain-containing protein n=1 Tax=Vigna mungo TaxID=3915 RepID=A0AAQ3P512_VIGMU
MENYGVEVVFHHGGKFLNDGSFGYRRGDTSTLMIDTDRWSYFEILAILKEMGYRNVKELWYSLGHRVLEDRMELLSDDKGAMYVVNIAFRAVKMGHNPRANPAPGLPVLTTLIALLNGKAHVFVVHKVSDLTIFCNWNIMLVNMVRMDGQGDGEDGQGEGQVIEEGEGNGAETAECGDDVEHVQDHGGVERDVYADVESAERDVQDHVVVDGDVVADAAIESGHGDVQDDVAIEGDDVVVEGDVAAEGDVQEDVGGPEEDVHHDVVGDEENLQEEVEVSSWIGFDEEVFFSEDDLVDVDVHADEELQNPNHEGSLFVEMGTTSGSTSLKFHTQARGLSDTEWESDSCGSIYASDESDEETPRDGHFGIFSEPLNMKEYKWQLGTYFPDKVDFIDAIRTYGIHTGRKLKIFKNDKRRICVKCCGS